MSVRNLFEFKIESEESEKEDKQEKEEMPISKRELRRKYDSIHIGRKVDTKAKRERKKILEKIKVCILFNFNLKGN